MLRFVMLRQAMLCNAMLCHAVPCCAVLCHARSCSAVLCRHNQELEEDSVTMSEEKERLRQEADSLAKRLEAIMHDKFEPRVGFDADTPIDKTLNFLQNVIGVSTLISTSSARGLVFTFTRCIVVLHTLVPDRRKSNLCRRFMSCICSHKVHTVR